MRVPSVNFMSSGLITGEDLAAHPLLGFLDALEGLLDDAASGNAWTMTPNQLAQALPRLTRAKARLTEVELRVLVEADRHDVGDETGHTTTPHWWAHATNQPKPAAINALRLARALDSSHEPTRAALASGVVLPDQAQVIVEAVQALPTDLVDPATVTDAEHHLIGLAEHHDAKTLRILGRKILDVLAPQIGEEHERRLLEAEEQHAAATASFTMRPDGHGSMIGRFKIPALAGQILHQHLAAIAAPRHRAATGFETGAARLPQPTGDTPVTRPLRLGAAFTEYIETRPAPGTPKAGGIPATVVVTMTMADLLGADKAATLDTGETISAAEARRLACEAGIIPAVLGTRSQILDLGRKTRFHTEPQRIALALRDGGCAVEHCDWPPSMCHAHHLEPWARGGGTSVKAGVLLCPRHHTLAHDNRYQLKTTPSGKVLFTRTT